MSATALTQRRSAIPTRSARNTNYQPSAELTTASSSGGNVRGQSNQAGPALTTFRNMRGAGVSGGFFVNTTGPVSFHNEGESSRRPLDIHGSVAVGTNRNIQPTDDHNSITTPGPSQKAEYDIYYNHLLVKGRGTPLWEPGPQMTFPNEYRRNGVSIGDVGILYRTGDFAFLFNIFLPADHEINMGRVPNGFIHLDKSRVEKTFKKSVVYDRGSCLPSSSLRRTDSSDFAFQSTGGEGAVLVMPDGALSEDLRHYKLVEKYTADNAKSWYEYVESDDCGMPTENGDIRVVVGMDKVSSWGMATFENVDVEMPLQFEFKDDGRGSHARTYKWERVAGRAGPPEEEIRDLLQGPDTPPLRNQCVFVRTLNVSIAGKVRDELAVYEVRAGCFRDCPSESSRHQTRPGQRNANTQSSQTGQPISHPSKFLNKYLLEKCPNAEVVITKDLDWMSVITENDTPTPNFEDVCARVLMSHIICENEGVVTLKKRKNVFSAGSMPDASAIHQQMSSEDVLLLSDDETYITGRLFLKAPDDPHQTVPPTLSDALVENRCNDKWPQIGESESLLHPRAPRFHNPDPWGGDDGENDAENAIDKGNRTECPYPRSMRRKKGRTTTTPVDNGGISVNGGEFCLLPTSARFPAKYCKGISASGMINPPGPLELAVSSMSPQVVTPPDSGPEEPFNSKDSEPPWDPARNTPMNYLDDDRPEDALEDAHDRNPKCTQRRHHDQEIAHLQQTPATRLVHSSYSAAEQTQNQETPPTDVSSRDISEKLYSKETRTWRISHQFMDILILCLLFADIVRSVGAVMKLKWVTNGEYEIGNFATTQGLIKMIGESFVAFSTGIAVYTFIGMLTKVRSSIGLVSSIATLAAVAFPAINQRSERYYMSPTSYWYWVGAESLALEEYFWLWTALSFSLFLCVPLYYLWGRGNRTSEQLTRWKFSFATSAEPYPHSRDQRRGSLVLLAYPVVYCVCILPLGIVRWIAIMQEARHGDMPSAATFALETICTILNVILLLKTDDFVLSGHPISISPARPLITSDPCRDERLMDSQSENRQGNLPFNYPSTFHPNKDPR